MKKVFFILAGIVSAASLSAQEPADALRYGWQVQSGSARQQAVGGAMGSLGGDISATYVNPAGLGFYRTSDMVLTLNPYFGNNKSTWYGRTEKDTRNGFGIGTSGFVLGSGSQKSRGNIKASAIALTVNRSANFNSNILYRGKNTENSYSQKFLEELRNNNVTTGAAASDFPFGTSLAINTFWIDTAVGWNAGNKTFRTLAPIGNLLQQQTVNTKGGITEYAIAYAANLNEKLYLGATLGIPVLRYERDAVFTEADASDVTTNGFNYASFTENLTTRGTGFNLKAGLIFKPVERIRLGLAVHSPSFYSLTDRYSASVTTDTEGFQGEQTQNSDFVSGGPAEFKYTLLTPYRVMVSGSYVLREVEDVRKQKGFITADLEYVNYKSSSFQPDADNQNDQSTKDYLKNLNKAIDNAYKGAINARLGGELKFTTIMVRAGLAYYGNPYKDLAGEKGSRFLISGGLGYRHKGFFIDASYVHAMSKDVYSAYRLQYSPFQVARIKNTTGNVLLTLGFKI